MGTGIGAGRSSAEAGPGLPHPEIGHVSVPRQPGDDSRGSARSTATASRGWRRPAIAARWGAPAEELGGADRERRAVWRRRISPSGLRSLVYVVVPERIVIGGGVSQLPGLVPLVADALRESLAGYPVLSADELASLVVPAELGQSAGPVGALVLAERARDGA